jgi:hypothetical protein
MYDPVATFGRGRAAHSIYFQVLGDHGFIGLGLYLAILVIAWRYAGRLARTATEGDEWAAEFGRMARIALAAYCVAGAALSMAYDASILCLFGLLSAAGRQAPAGQCSRSLHLRDQSRDGPWRREPPLQDASRPDVMRRPLHD